MPAPVRADPLAALTAREGVASAMVAAREAVDVVLRDRGLRRSQPADTVESLLLGAHASAGLEGSPCGVDELRAGNGDAAAAAALRVSAELVGLVPVWRHSPVQVLARLHVLAGDPGDPARGRPVSPAGADRLHGVAELVLGETAAPAMVLAAVVHGEVAAAEAFSGRNGLVARAAERLVLVASGVDPVSVTVPEAGHARSRPAYEQALAGYRSGDPAGVAAWLLHAAAAYAHGAERAPLR